MPLNDKEQVNDKKKESVGFNPHFYRQTPLPKEPPKPPKNPEDEKDSIEITTDFDTKAYMAALSSFLESEEGNSSMEMWFCRIRYEILKDGGKIEDEFIIKLLSEIFEDKLDNTIIETIISAINSRKYDIVQKILFIAFIVYFKCSNSFQEMSVDQFIPFFEMICKDGPDFEPILKVSESYYDPSTGSIGSSFNPVILLHEIGHHINHYFMTEEMVQEFIKVRRAGTHIKYPHMRSYKSKQKIYAVIEEVYEAVHREKLLILETFSREKLETFSPKTINQVRTEMIYDILEMKNPALCAASDIICGFFRGEQRIVESLDSDHKGGIIYLEFGHSDRYYSDPEDALNEMLTCYGVIMRSSEDKKRKALELLNRVLGTYFVDFLDKTYQTIMSSIPGYVSKFLKNQEPNK